MPETNKRRRWRLRKDTLFMETVVPAGAILVSEESLPYARSAKPSCKYNIDFIVAHPEWFEPIPPRKVLVIEVETTTPSLLPFSVGLKYGKYEDGEWLDHFNVRIEERE